jgi:hypothetical protein
MMDSSLHTRFALVALALAAGACATLAGAATGGENLPNAAAGPFRALRSDEVGNLRSAPNVLVDDQTFPRDGTVIDADGDLSTPEVVGFFAMTLKVGAGDPDPSAPTTAIVRYSAADGRSFDRVSTPVLTLENPWEGSKLGAPSALRVEDEVFLYYMAEGGIGLARSSDGIMFTREPAPVFAADPSAWDAGNVPANPGVVRLDDGSFRMFYDVPSDNGGRQIGEARSDDGLMWERVGNASVLEPRNDINPDDLFYDGASVGAPYPVLGTTAEGRRVLRVYYAAIDALNRRSIGIAARYTPSEGPLQRAIAPVFNNALGTTQPCVVVYPGYSLLFATQLAGTSKSQQIPANAAALSPADAVLPPRTPN